MGDYRRGSKRRKTARGGAGGVGSAPGAPLSEILARKEDAERQLRLDLAALYEQHRELWDASKACLRREGAVRDDDTAERTCVEVSRGLVCKARAEDWEAGKLSLPPRIDHAWQHEAVLRNVLLITRANGAPLDWDGRGCGVREERGRG